MAEKDKSLILFTVTNELAYDQRMIRICRTLHQFGYTVELVGRMRNADIDLTKLSFPYKRIKCVFNKGFLFYAEFNLRLLFYFLNQKPMAVCSIDLDTILASRFYPRKIVRIYDAHEYFTELPEIMHRPFVRRVWKIIEGITIPRMDICYTVNHSIAAILGEKYKREFKVVMNVPVLLDYEPSYEIDAKKIILYQGVLNVGRGLETMIGLMKNLDDVEFHLVGEGDLSSHLRDLVQKSGLNEKVKFLGYLSPHDLKSYTKKAWVGINLLESESKNYYYSLANKFFDYMHSGIPQITMQFPEYEKINSEFEVALLLKEVSEKEILSCINKLHKKDVYDRLANNAGKARDKYKWQEEQKSLLAIYDDII